MSLATTRQKKLGAYYTPSDLARTLVGWVRRTGNERLLDPACGDGQFLCWSKHATGCEIDSGAARCARTRAPQATVFEGDFFEQVERFRGRFDCVVGNPPFIRYQQYSGKARLQAQAHCRSCGVEFSGLASAWAPFVVGAASTLRVGGRLSFVVPAEIGHASYAAPVVEFLTRHFDEVQLIAVRDRVFPGLSEDIWLLYAESFGGTTERIKLTRRATFRPASMRPSDGFYVQMGDWRRMGKRLRPFLAPSPVRDMYRAMESTSVRLGEVARVGIGYVSGANDFFHLRPSESKRLGIPYRFLKASVRKASWLPNRRLTRATVNTWIKHDDPMWLLAIPRTTKLPASIKSYVRSAKGHAAREAYKCRTRSPWYSVPDVSVPDAFLSYMSSDFPRLVVNAAGCTCTNSVHCLRLSNGLTAAQLRALWDTPLTRLSCELEGHSLGGGLLKLEPGEAARILVHREAYDYSQGERDLCEYGIRVMRSWRHYE